MLNVDGDYKDENYDEQTPFDEIKLGQVVSVCKPVLKLIDSERSVQGVRSECKGLILLSCHVSGMIPNIIISFNHNRLINLKNC